MSIIDILKRKDGSSVVVAVVIAILASQAVQGWATYPSHVLSGQNLVAGGGWRNGFWAPLVALIVTLAIFEALTKVYLWLADTQTSSKK